MKRFISLILLCLILLSSCSSRKDNGRLTCKLFYFTGDNRTEIVSVSANLEAASTEDAIGELFSKLCTPEKKSHISAIPKSVSLIDSSFKDGVCYLTLSPAYANLSRTRLISLNFVLAGTMSALPGVTQVSISCGEITNTFASDEFISSTPPVYSDSHVVKLYFPSNDYKNILMVEKTILPDPNKSPETSVAELLLETPEDPNLISPFPSGTRINSVHINNGVCILDVSSTFITSAPHDEEKETAIIFSIVDTLMELDGVNSVRFFIDGNPGYGYAYYNLASPISRFPQSDNAL